VSSRMMGNYHVRFRRRSSPGQLGNSLSNSTQREKPYPFLTCLATETKASKEEHRCCMAVDSSCREMFGSVLKRAKPFFCHKHTRDIL
jgi:hypothetical protein